MAGFPTGRNGRLLAAGLAVLALLAIWLGLISPITDWYGARAAHLTDLRLRVARESALIETLPALKTSAAAAAHTPARATVAVRRWCPE